MTEELENIVHELMWSAWHQAANAFRLYPENKHTYSDVSDYLKGEMKRKLANWQAPNPDESQLSEGGEEKAYSYEDMDEAFEAGRLRGYDQYDRGATSENTMLFGEWIKQYRPKQNH